MSAPVHRRLWLSLLAPLLGVLAAVLWGLAVVVLCWPLWGVSVLLLQLSNLCLWAGYRLRDGLEWLGNKTETALR